MSFSEIKAGIADLSVEERLELAAAIAHLNRAEDPVWQAELDRRLNAMGSGRKHGQNKIQKRHRELSGR
jgi:hypothetical protein